MSWSTNIPRNMKASEARVALEHSTNVPFSVREYADQALAALQRHYGSDVLVDVSAHGHLHNGEAGNYDISTATIDVRRSPATTV